MHYTFKSTPTTSFKFRNQTITKSNQLSSFPGPGNYNVLKPLPNSGTIAPAKQKRQLFKFVDQIPGPGSYELKSYTTAGPQRSISARLLNEPFKTPGPLDYQGQLLKTKNKAPVFSMGARSKSTHKIIQDKNLEKPGPGFYNPQNLLNNSKAFNFGSSVRRDLTETQKTPAPSYYSPQKAIYASVTNPRCKIGTEKRQLRIKDIEQTPGPALYNNKSLFIQNKTSNKGFTCRSKVKDLIAEQLCKNPGPGFYKSQYFNLKNNAPRCATTQSKRKTFIDEIKNSKKDLPAFSSGDNNFFNTSKYRASSASIFGKSNRRSLDQNQNTPGPVAYDHDRLKVLNKQPSFSCTKTMGKQQFLKQSQQTNPGPGYYNIKMDLVKQATKSSIVPKSQRPNFDKQRKKPGVGQYHIQQQKQQKDYKFGFTKQKRQSFTDKNSDAKNGTHYNIGKGVANPPTYMRVQSKTNFSPRKSNSRSTGF